MRLTLRTLLAYLDDILEPAQAKEIGNKISESEYASALVTRIQESMRRRRLSAPDVNGPGSGLDPNIVAEYLDNTLPAESIADVEKVCLDSDMHLAEVAACHQILTLVLGEPVDVPLTSRERLYALGPIHAGGDKHPAGKTAATETAEASESAAVTAAAHATPLQEPLPDYLRPRPLFQRALPYLVVGVVAVLWGALIIMDPTLFPGEPDSTAVEVPAETDPEATNEVAGVGDQPPVQGIPAAEFEPETGRELPTQHEPEPVAGTTGEMPAVRDSTTAAIGEDQPGINGEQPEIADTTDTGTPAAPPAVAPSTLGDPSPSDPSTAADLQMPPVEYNSATGVLLRFDDERQQWVVMPRRALVHAGERLAAPEPFQSHLDVRPELLQVTMLGGTHLQVLGPSEAGPVGVKLDRGRVLFEAAVREGDKFTPIPLEIQIGDERWRLELMTGETRCGIEVRPRQPQAVDEQLGRDWYHGACYVAAGEVRLSDAAGDVRSINSSAAWSLTPSDRESAKSGAAAEDAPPPVAVPLWMSDDVPRASSVERRYAAQFEQEFVSNQPVSFTMSALVKDSRPRIAELAVNCLALTNRLEPLVTALAQVEHEEGRLAAIEGIRTWLPTAADNGERLQELLDKVFHTNTAAAVYRLLWGFNVEDARNRITSEQLVHWLGHEHVAVRQLAAYHVYLLTGRTYDYHPLAPASQRQAAVDRWVNHVARNDGLLAE